MKLRLKLHINFTKLNDLFKEIWCNDSESIPLQFLLFVI